MNDIISNNTSETWIEFIMSNYKQVLLMIMVVLIIYSVEYVVYVNTIWYDMLAMPSIPGVTNVSQLSIKNKHKHKKMKR
jgi:hypothetical protein